MVTALPPQDFLGGMEGCGDALGDVEIQLDADGGLMVRTQRLAAGRWNGDPHAVSELLRDGEGWWRSGDLACWLPGHGGQGQGRSLQLLGRRDAVINSGGETLFLEMLETRMGVFFAALPIQSFLLVGLSDSYWGEKLVGLVRFSNGLSDAQYNDLLLEMGERCRALTPAERPKQWLHCPSLVMNVAGKWERTRWASWTANQL
jgi:O-succinylbenzoic acid--CoA ligase